MMRRLLLILGTVTLAGCFHAAPSAPAAPEPGASPRAIAVYRAIAESIYVGTTNRVVAVATSSMDLKCAATDCADLAARFGMETLWFAKGDSSEARSARADLLAHAVAPFDIAAVAHGRSMLLEADAGDIPGVDANIQEWIHFRAAHADASGAVRMSPIGFSKSGHTALAIVDWRCGPTCGHTLGVALTATSDSTWSVDEMLLLSSVGK